MIKKGLYIFLFLLSCLDSEASHIIGNDFTYECLGNNEYRFTLSIYRDCRPQSLGGGSSSSIAYDNPAFITVYDGNGDIVSFGDQYTAFSNVVVPLEIDTSCITNVPLKCLNRLRFSFTKTLPPNNTGYYIVYQRCCRNFSTLNIATPDETGVTFFCFIPPGPNIICNSSPVFRYSPPQVICINIPLEINVSAIDDDNDSLSYSLCSAISGATRQLNKPNIASPPPYSSVVYASPYSATMPMAANPQISIDPVTGLLTGTPNQLGIFDIAVCCSEWRNGVLINTTRREFQLEVTNCSKVVVADIPVLSNEDNTHIIQCKSQTVNFVNTSTGGNEYLWDFGDTNLSNDTSSLFEPSYTYSDTGTYVVKLVVNQSSDCPDSISRLVKVYPEFKTDFTYSGLLCEGEPISFQDLSTSSFFPINYWNWQFGDGITSADQNPIHRYAEDGMQYPIQFISGNTAGCLDTAQLTLDIPALDFFVGNDTIVLKNTNLQFNARGAQAYSWTPSSFLDNPFIGNPIGFYSDTGRINYIVNGITAEGCPVQDDITVFVADKAYIVVPNAFTPNSDGLNDLLKIISVGYIDLKYFRIFNRWGQMVFETNDFSTGWDGRLKGQDQPIGTYYWVIEAKNIMDKERTYRGDVTIIR